MIERARHFLWDAFALLLPWQTVWIVREVFVGGEKWQYGTWGLYLSDAALLGAGACVVFRMTKDSRKRVFRDRALLFLVLFLLLIGVSSLRSGQYAEVLLSMWRVFLMGIAYAVARYGEFPIRRTIAMFSLSMFFQALLALSQWVMQSVPPSTLSGIASHEAWRPGTSVLKAETGRYLRAYGGFEHPNIFGGALAMTMLGNIWLLATLRTLLFRAAILLSLSVSGFVLVLTFSRSAWIALSFGMGTYVLAAFLQRSQAFRIGGREWGKRYFLGMLVCAFSFVVSFSLIRDIAMSRFSEETLVREGSLSDREISLKQASVAIRESPIFGVGNFTMFTRDRFPKSGAFVGDFQPVHAVPILILAEYGAAGFVLIVSFFAVSVGRAWRERCMYEWVILSALVPMLFIDHWMWTSHFGIVWVGFLLGINVASKPVKRFETLGPTAS